MKTPVAGSPRALFTSSDAMREQDGCGGQERGAGAPRCPANEPRDFLPFHRAGGSRSPMRIPILLLLACASQLFADRLDDLTKPPHSPTPVRVMTVSDAAGAKANPCSQPVAKLLREHVDILTQYFDLRP